MKRHAFMISDGTGITAENLGNSLITQFGDIQFEKQTIPYVDTIDKAEKVVHRINACYQETHIKPLLFITLINPEIVNVIKHAHASIFDLFNTFLDPLEKELKTKSSYTVGRTHAVSDTESYAERIDAIDYTLSHDDGIKAGDYSRADIILIGVSRCGKTPSCLYMALHFGILAANYPFTEEDLINFKLPEVLRPYKHKLFGLTIDLERLRQIRNERRPNSRYSSQEQCQREIIEVEAMYRQENIPYLNSTRFSIEEIATKVLSIAGIKRKL